MSDLDELRAKVTSIADEITSFKETTPVNKEGIAALIPQLLAAKVAFAQANNGIGVDGKPYEAPLSKAEKKKRAKEEKAKAAAAASGGASAAAEVGESGKQVRKLRTVCV